VTFTQGGAAVAASPAITVNDVDSLDLASATVSIGTGFLAGDVLGAATSGTAILASYNAVTGVLTLSGSDTVAHYQQVLDSVTFSSTSANPTNYGADLSRGLSWQVNDGTLNSNTVTSNLTVAGVDQAPLLSGAGNTVSFTQGAAPVAASSGITVSDVDSLNLASATVSIASGFFAGDALAAVTTGTTITASYNTGTGVLTLSGSDTVAHYQQVLDSVTFSSSSANPTNYGADLSRGLSWTVNDGTLNSNTVTSNVTVVGVDRAPVLAGAGNTVSFTQGGAPVVASSGITVSDADNLNLASATVSIGTGFFAGDTLAAATTGTTITVSYNTGTGVLTLSGSDTVAHYQQVLDSVTYSSGSANPTNDGTDASRGLTWQVNDGTLNSNTVTSNVTVVGVATAPVLAGAGNTVTFTQGGAPVVASSGITVSDADSLTLASATVSISSGFFAGDVLTAATTGTAITASYNAATGVLSLSGTDTLANYRTVLESVTFSSGSVNPTNYGADTNRGLSWQVNDGTLNSNTATSNVTVVGVDQAPVLAGAGNTVTFTQGGGPVAASSGITVSDVDSLNLASATVSIGTGFFAGDTLAAATSGTTITASYNAGTGVLSLSGSDTVAHYQQVLDSVTFSSGSANPTNFGADVSRTLSWQANDGTLASNTVTSNVTVVGVATAPVLSGAGNTVTFTQDGAPVAASSGITIADATSLDLASATVSISAGFFSGDALAAVTTGTAITATYNTATWVLTLSGTDTVAHYQQVLDSVTFTSTSANPTNFGTDSSRALSWKVNDGTLNSNTVTSNVTVVGVDQAPVLSSAGNTVTFTQGGAPVTASAAIAVSDADSLTLASATASISIGFFAGDTLAAVTAGTTITASYNAGTGVLTLSGSDTVAHYQQVMDSVTFSSSSANPTNYGTDSSRGLSWTVNDGTLNSNTVTSNVTVVGVDQAPVLSGAGNTVTFTQGSAPVVASSGITVSDVDSLDLASATVSIGAGFFAGDTLAAVTTGTTITASYNAGTGVLTLSGSDTVAHYQAALESVTYSSSSVNPTNSGADLSRTLSWQINDGTLGSNTVTSTVSVTEAEAPLLSGAGNTVTYTQGGTPAIASAAIAVADVESTTLASATVSISSGLLSGDTLSAATGGTGISASYSATTGVLTLSGTATLAVYQTVLESVTFSSTSVNPTNSGADTSRTLSWQVSDGTLASNTATSTVSVTEIDAPVLSGASNAVTYTQGGTPVFASPAIAVVDVESTTLASATVSIGTGFFAGDTLAAATTGTTITASYNAGTGVLTLSGTDTLAHYQTVLDSVTFSSSSANPTNYGTNTSRGLTWQVNDGTLNSNTVASNIIVAAVDQAPVLSGAGNTVTFTQGGSPVVASSGITVADVDNLNLASATVSIGTGFFAGDTLAAATTGTTIAASYNAGTGVLTLSGSDTLAHYQQVLDSVTFSSGSSNPTNYGADLSRGLTWQVNDGTLNSNSVTSNVTVVGVATVPVLSGAGNTVTFTQGGSPVVASSGIMVADADSLTLASATVSIGTGFFAGDTLAAVTTGTTITASYNAGTGVLTLSGSDTLAHYQTVLESITYSSVSVNPTNSGADLSRTLSWQVNDGTLGSNTVASNVTVVAVATAPVLAAAGNTVTFTQGGAPVVASSAITVADADSPTLASATVSISSGFFAGDILAAVTTGTTIAASYNAGTGVLTLSGSDTLANYQTVLDSVTFSSGSANPTNYGADTSRGLSWQVNDGTLNSNTVASNVTVVGVDQAPVLSGAGNTVTFTQEGTAAIASPGITVADVDNLNLASATVSISSGYFAGDTLAAATTGTTITASYNAGTGVLTLSGSDTLANYQAVLDSVTFSSSNADPTNSGTDFSRTLTWQVNDGTLPSNTVTSNVTVAAAASKPSLSGAGNTVTFTQGGSPITASPGVTITGSLTLASATVSISSGFFIGDVLGASTTGTNITANYDASAGVLTLTGSDTEANYQTVLDSVTFSSTSANPTNFGGDLSRGLSWQVYDGKVHSNTVTSTVTVVGVDQAPVLSGAGNTVTFTQGGAAVVASSGITVTDADNLNLASATVSISTGFFAGDTLAAVTTGTGITASYNTGTGVLTLSGSASVANYQAVLDSVTFSSTSANPTNSGADTSRSLSWQVNDGTLSSNTVTSNVTVVGVTTAPVLSGAGNTVTYTQGGAAVTASPAIAVSDADSPTLAAARVWISTGFFAGDTLAAVTTGTGITATYSASSGLLTLTGTATLATYQAVLDSVTFSSTSANPTNTGADTSRTLSWQVNDGTLTSNTATSTVNVAVATTAPVLSGAGNTVTFTQGGSAVAASPGIAVSDTESANLVSARVSFGGGFFAGDVLTAVTTGTAITASYSTTTGLLTLTGTDTLAHYQQVLDSVTYSSTSANPTDFGADTSRTLSWRVNDGTHNSAIVTSTVTVVGVAQAPVLGGGGHTATYTQAGAAVTASLVTTVSDADSRDLASASVSISAGFFAGDVLSAVTTGYNITASYNAATGVLTLTGSDTVANYQHVLHAVKFSSTSANPTDYGTDTSRTLSWQVSDGTLASNTVTSSVTVVGVDQVPVLAGAGNTVTFTQGGTPVTASPAITVSSADNLNLASARVSFGSGFFAGDVLTAVTTGTAITASYSTTTGLLTLTGSDTLAHYQQVLESVTYSSTSANPTDFGADTSRTLNWRINDGTHNSAIVTTTVTVAGVAQAPVLGGGGSTATYTQGGGAVTASLATTVSDAANRDLASASVSIGAGFFAGDVLSAVTTGYNITASYNAATGVLTLTGSDTVASYQHVLHAVKFSSSSANPTDYGTDTSRTLSWQVSDGTLASNTVTSSVTVVGVDQAPVLAGAGNTATFTQGAAPVAASPAITASSADNLNLASASVTISTGLFAGDTLAAVTTGTAITASFSAATGVLTLTGSDTVAHYQQVLDSVTYTSTSANPTNFGADLSRTLSWRVNDGTHNSAIVTSTVAVAGVDQAPVLGGGGNTATYTQGGGAVTASLATTVVDVDSLRLASATVSISGGFLAGDVLSAVTTGYSITASYNAATGVLTLTGSDTVANYQHVLHSVKFSSTSANPTNFGTDTSRTLTWQVNDGTLASNTVTSSVTVVGVDQAPTVAGAGNTVTFTPGGAPVAASPAITVSSADNLNLASASVTISTGFFAGDVLAAVTTGTAITATYNATTHVLTLTGSDTVAHYQQVLESVTYTSTSADPTNSGADLSRTLTWRVNDGTQNSTAVTSKVTVAALPLFLAAAATVRPVRPASRAGQSKSPKLANTRLSMGSLSAAPGASVIVPVSISNARGLQSMKLAIRYDARALTPVSVERSALTEGFSYTAKVVEPGVLRIEATSKKPLRLGEGELFGLKFALAPTATGSFRIDFVSASLNDERLLVSDPDEGAIIVKAPQPAAAGAQSKPAINLNQQARSFELSNGKTHAWLDEFLKPSDGTKGKANSWTVVIKPRTLH
jgi:hypothetical protein